MRRIITKNDKQGSRVLIPSGLRRQVRTAAKRVLVSTVGADRTARIVSQFGRARGQRELRRDPELRRSVARLGRLHDSRHGETAVVIGNGPSLNETNLELLRGVATFGLNRIYLKFEELGFHTTYHVCVNDLIMQQCVDEIARVRGQKFCDRRARKHMTASQAEEFTFLRSVPGPFFATDPASSGIWQGATVTYVAMQLAYYFGFTQVLLIGVDHRFHTQGSAHKAVVSEGQDPNHFDPNYFGAGFVWQLPDLETSEQAYSLAKEAFEADGREIVDCTVGGALTIFRKSTLESELS